MGKPWGFLTREFPQGVPPGRYVALQMFVLAVSGKNHRLAKPLHAITHVIGTKVA